MLSPPRHQNSEFTTQQVLILSGDEMNETIIQRNRGFGCFFYAIMGENWMTKMLENWEITDRLTENPRLKIIYRYSFARIGNTYKIIGTK